MFGLSCFITLLCLLQIPDPSAAFHKRHSKGLLLNRRSEEPSAPVEPPQRPPVFAEDEDVETIKPLTVSTQFSDVALTCQAMSRPVPTIHWLKDGKRVKGCQIDTSLDHDFEDRLGSNQEWLGLSATTSTLFLDCLDGSDAANYTCVADTPTLRSTKSTVLTVERPEKPLEKALLKCASKGVPARIYMSTRTRLEYEGNTVQLFCRAQGNPKPKITWFDAENNPIVDGGHFKLADNGDLVIYKISWAKHMGVFRCAASNEFGTDTADPFLYPTGRSPGMTLPF